MGDRAMDLPRMPFTLQHGLGLLRRWPMLGMLALLLGVPLALALLLLLCLADADASPWEAVVASYRAAAEDDPGLRYQLWLLAGLLPLGALALIGHRLARIRVTPSGIDGYLPRWLGMGLFGETGGRWRVAWSEIRAVRMECPGPPRAGGLGRRMAALQGIKLARLVIETDRGAVRIRPFPWHVPGGEDHRLGLRELSLAGRVDARERLARAPLVQALAAQGHAPEWEEASSASTRVAAGYDLARHRGMVGQLVVMGLAGLYTVADTFFLGQFHLLDPLPWWPFVAAGAVALLVIPPLGRGAPALERRTVAALTIAAIVAAVYPALLRINALTAQPEVVEYTATAPGQFEAPGERPVIDLSEHGLEAYWAEVVGSGGQHRFTLLRGALGFRQLALGPLYERTRAFYRERGAGD